MRIAFDYTYGVGATSGIGRYANRLARAFPAVASEDDSFSLFFIDFLRSFRKEVSCPECATDPRPWQDKISLLKDSYFRACSKAHGLA